MATTTTTTTTTGTGSTQTTQDPAEAAKQAKEEFRKNAEIAIADQNEKADIYYKEIQDLQEQIDYEEKHGGSQEKIAELKKQQENAKKQLQTAENSIKALQKTIEEVENAKNPDCTAYNKKLQKAHEQYTKELEKLKEQAEQIDEAAREAVELNASDKRLTDKEVAEINTQNLAMATKNFKLPKWTYNNFVEEIDSFRKGLSSLTGEPGWFYFKLFFHFDEKYGLLGDIVANSDDRYKNDGKEYGNTAFNYLLMRRTNYLADNLTSRLYALVKFVKYLSFINCNSPWFFNSISGLANCKTDLQDLTKEKSIDIGCLEDAIDMRLTSLFHLYQHACFDDVNIKEIIPQNLRKFNMTIIVFHTPVKLIDTSAIITNQQYNTLYYNQGDSNTNTNVVPEKTAYPAAGLVDSTFNNRMSYKAYTLKGCEFDYDSTSSVVFGNQLNNDQPVNLGKATFKIKFDRCFSHVMNAWEHFYIGSDGTYYYKTDSDAIDGLDGINADANSHLSDRLQALYETGDTAVYNRIVDLTETNLRKAFMDYNDNCLGNLYNVDTTAYVLEWIRYNNSMVGDLRWYASDLYLSNYIRYDNLIDPIGIAANVNTSIIGTYRLLGDNAVSPYAYLNASYNSLSGLNIGAGVGLNVL